MIIYELSLNSIPNSLSDENISVCMHITNKIKQEPQIIDSHG